MRTLVDNCRFGLFVLLLLRCRLSSARSNKEFNSWRMTSQAHLLTIYELLHVLDESVCDAKSLGCGSPSLVCREPVQTLQDCPNVFVPEKNLTVWAE